MSKTRVTFLLKDVKAKCQIMNPALPCEGSLMAMRSNVQVWRDAIDDLRNLACRLGKTRDKDTKLVRDDINNKLNERMALESKQEAIENEISAHIEALHYRQSRIAQLKADTKALVPLIGETNRTINRLEQKLSTLNG